MALAAPLLIENLPSLFDVSQEEVLSPFFCSCCPIAGDPISAQKEETEKEPDTDTSHFVPFLFISHPTPPLGGVGWGLDP
jgi:hypothetical protein